MMIVGEIEMKVSVPRFERPVRGGIAAISVVLMFQNMIFSKPGLKWWVS